MVFAIILALNRASWRLLVAGALASGWYFLLVTLIARPRPTVPDVLRVTEHPGASSYPSGHMVLYTFYAVILMTTLGLKYIPRRWQPIGAEADASWAKATDGTVAGFGSFNATLRDYGRLGMLLADDGVAGGKQVVPRDYLLDATDWHRQPEAFAPKRATPYFGYGYQFWLFPSEKRRFALLGVYGQSIFVDPEFKLVLVITAAAKTASVGKAALGREREALWRGVIGTYGSW